MTTDNRQIQIRRGTSSAWSSANTVLAAGEPAFDSTVEKLKVGDGTTAWNSQPFIGDSSIIVGRGTFASRPGSGTNTGDLYYCTDIGNVYRWSGSVWDMVDGGDLTAFTPPSSSGWTALNSGSVSAALDSRIVSASSITSDNWKGETRTLSPASNYTATIYVDPILNSINYMTTAMILRNSSSGLMCVLGLQFNGGWVLICSNYNSVTSLNGGIAANISPTRMPNWFRVRDDNTNRYYEYSFNGVDWVLYTSTSRTAFVTPDQIGWGVNAISASTGLTQSARLRHFTLV